jgi:rhamnosyltransferase subunit B
MKIVITALGSGGDVFPFIALGQALQQRGHTVALLANPHFAEAVARASLSMVPLGTEDEYLAALRQPDIWHPRRGFAVLWRHIMEWTPQILTIIEGQIVPGQTVLVGSTLSLATRLAQERHGLPAAMVHLSPHCFLSAYEFPVTSAQPLPSWIPLWARRALLTVMDRGMVDATCAPPLNALRTTLGLPPVHSVMRHWLHSPDLTIGAFPDGFAMPQPDWPASAVVTGFPRLRAHAESPLPDAVQAFLSTGSPPLAFTAGTGMAQAQDFFACALQTATALQRRALFVTRFADQLPERLPPSIKVAAHLPFDRLLPRVAALVHHGGIGTTAAALAAGVPQLIAPFAFDQFDNAARIVRLGVGQRCATLHPEHWRAELAPLLHPAPALTAALRRSQQRMTDAPDASALIADRIEALARARFPIASTR